MQPPAKFQLRNFCLSFSDISWGFTCLNGQGLDLSESVLHRKATTASKRTSGKHLVLIVCLFIS
jgi:hypothetical protein